MKRYLKICTAFALIAIISLCAFYVHYDRFSRQLVKQQFPREKANAVKHAYAAAQVADIISYVTGDSTAEAIVLQLGYANEYLEQVTRFPRDVPAEITRDLLNNQLGISAALRCGLLNPEKSLRDIMLDLALQGVLMDKKTEILLPTHEQSATSWRAVNVGKKHFLERRVKVVAALAASPTCKAKP